MTGLLFARRPRARPIFPRQLWFSVLPRWRLPAQGIHTFQNDRVFRITQGVTGSHVFARPIAAAMSPARTSDLFTFVGVHLERYDRKRSRAVFTEFARTELTTPEHTRKKLSGYPQTVGSDFERQRNGSSSRLRDALSRVSLPSSRIPLIAGTSTGDGR